MIEWQNDGKFLGFTSYERGIREEVAKAGGWENAHTHARWEILDPVYLRHEGITPIEASSKGLRAKQNLVGKLHFGKAFEEADFKQRTRDMFDLMFNVLGYKSVSVMFDATADIRPGEKQTIGELGLDWMSEVKREYEKQNHTIYLGTHTPFGFSRTKTESWKVFEKISRRNEVSFIGCLPERDWRDDHIGYQACLRRSIDLAIELQKELQVHCGQVNHPGDTSVDVVAEAVEWYGIERNMPKIWAVHAISPACYDEKRIIDLADKMAALNIGVRACLRAAISMLQHRNVVAPIHNCTAPLLIYMSRGVEVKIGTDNMADPFVPSGNPDMYREIEFFVDPERCYLPGVAVKIATGKPLNDTDRDNIDNVLDNARKAREEWQVPVFRDWQRKN